jgi:DNA-binding transcriptional ArsR family regulator
MNPLHDITDPTVAKALAHPLRGRVLTVLQDRTASPSELATELDVPLGVLSYHIRRLTALGFLELVRRVPRRGAVEHYYTATMRSPITDAAWQATPGTVKRAALGTAISELGTQVTAAAAAGGFDAAESRLLRLPVTVDRQGFLELSAELERLGGRLESIQEEARARREAGAAAEEALSASVVMMLFEDQPPG